MATEDTKRRAFDLPRFHRRNQGRWLGGLCAAVAEVVGLSPAVVRAGLVALTLVTGPALPVCYIAAWIVLPAGDEPVPAQDRGPVLDLLAMAAIGLGAVLLLTDLVGRLPGEVVVPMLVAAAGSALVWGRSGESPKSAPLRVAVGVSLVAGGALAVLAAVSDLRTIGRSALGAVVVVAGTAVLAGPGLARLARDLGRERRQRIRSEERAELAAHLHDGVLQTLALIQKRAGDDREVRALARRQERELRDWLYGSPAGAGFDAGGRPATVAALLRAELAEVEDGYGVRLDAVLVGDAPLDDAARALCAAGREAARNAALHAGVEAVDVYLEVEPERISLFVRDRGRGFDPAAVPADRRGLADSVRGRVARHGGTAEIRSAPGEGTEVELSVPRGPGGLA